MNKVERDPKTIKSVMSVAMEVFNDDQVSNIAKLTRIRAAIFWANEVGLDTTKLKDLEKNLEGKI